MIKNTEDAHYLTRRECAEKSEKLRHRQEEDNTYMIRLTFKKDEGGWYADVPTHTRGQNSMVCGADALVERMSEGDNSVTVKFRTVQSEGRKPLVTLKRMAHAHGIGGTYIACGATFIPFPCWICDVLHTVIGEHSKRIYVYSIRHENI